MRPDQPTIHSPPVLPRAFLIRALGDTQDARAIEGDLLEEFTDLLARKSVRAARRWYWRAAVSLGLSRGLKRVFDAINPGHGPGREDYMMRNTLRADGVARDLRYALRAVRNEPGFFAFGALIIGLGVGACTAVFSVINPLMLRALPFHEPERLVWIANSGPPSGGMSAVTSRTSNLRDFRELNQSFEDIAGYNAFFGQGRYNLIGGGEPEKLVGVGVTQQFLDVLGVGPLHGRNFVDEEAVWGGRPAVILSHGFWTRRFGADPAIVGTRININDNPTEVVGVLPPSFDFATIFAPSTHVDFLRPWPIADETDRTGNSLSMIGRLKPGATVESAQAELDVIVAGLQERDPDRWGLGARVSDLQAKISGAYRTAMILLAAAAGTVMLIVCVNLSNLLMAKGPKRTREMALRRALGATRLRLLRQLIVESVVLTLGGALVGVATAYGATRLVAASNGVSIPMLRTVSVDGAALLFTLGLAIVSGILMGIVPALQATHGDGSSVLNDSSRGSSEGIRSTRLRDGLVVAETAMACLLLVFGGLFLRSFRNVLDVEMGFQPAGAVGWTLSTNQRFETDEEMTLFFDRVIEAVEAVPGVEMAGLIDVLPLGRNRTWGTVRALGESYEDGELQSSFPHLVDHRYLRTMQIPLLAGRHFTPDDTEDAPRVVILNESAAKGVFRGADPIGQTVDNVGREFEVVGVAADVRHRSLEEGAGWEMYFPYGQISDFQTLDMVVRSRLPLETLVPGVSAALRSVDRTMPTDEFQPLTGIVDRSVSPRRFVLLLLTAFGGTALLLAALGIYGVLSYSVSQRIPEIGIRMALGESGSQLQRRFVSKTMVLAGTGVAVGAALSLVGTRWIGSVLYGVEPTDPFTFAGMAVILLTSAMLAGYLPARRASRIDPTTAFRQV